MNTAVIDAAANATAAKVSRCKAASMARTLRRGARHLESVTARDARWMLILATAFARRAQTP